MTIVALSTATPAALGVIRLSGKLAITAVNALFTPKFGGSFQEQPSRKLIFGVLKGKDGKVIDQVLATYAKGPNSYTGEDTAEVHCHGSPMVLRLALEAFYAQGCRQAEAGEFTQRAFLSGKLDLNQAEAVADLLSAKNQSAVHQAVGQLEGRLSEKILSIYHAFSGLMAHFCAVLDYPDEDIDSFGAETMRETLETQLRALETLESTWERGNRIAHGIPSALIGLPNGGKSSLLNAFLGYDRAIVTDIAGTTRDTIEEEINLGDCTLRLIDTAGLRDSDDPIEQMGIARSRHAMEQAQLLLIVIDSSQPLTGEEPQPVDGIPTIYILNKQDKEQKVFPNDLNSPYVCAISAKNGEGLEELQRVILSIFHTDSLSNDQVSLTNMRQVAQVRQAIIHARGALEALDMGMTADMILTDVEGAMGELGILTGQNVPQDVTREIFSRFCVGK